MNSKTFLKFAAFYITFLSFSIHAQDYKADSLAVRAILDSNGLQSIMVNSVADTLEGRIWKLVVNGKKMTTIPSEIGNLTELKILEFRANELTTIPPEIGSLSNLLYLELRSNRLTSIPPEIGNLIGMTRLFLSYNNLTAIPPEIAGCIKLSMLYLFYNEIAALPSEIGNMAILNVLSLEGNRLTAIPPEIGNLSNLRSLTLDENDLRSIPSEIGNCSNLMELDLAWNNLTSLPESLIKLSPESNLDLGYNNLINTNLSDTLITWADTWDPDWNQTQPIMYHPAMNLALHSPVGIQAIQNNTITYYLSVPVNFKLDVLDLQGRLLKRLVDAYQQAGTHSAHWNGRHYSSGSYYFILTTDNAATIEKAIFVK